MRAARWRTHACVPTEKYSTHRALNHSLTHSTNVLIMTVTTNNCTCAIEPNGCYYYWFVFSSCAYVIWCCYCCCTLLSPCTHLHLVHSQSSEDIVVTLFISSHKNQLLPIIVKPPTSSILIECIASPRNINIHTHRDRLLNGISIAPKRILNSLTWV